MPPTTFYGNQKQPLICILSRANDVVVCVSLCFIEMKSWIVKIGDVCIDICMLYMYSSGTCFICSSGCSLCRPMQAIICV